MEHLNYGEVYISTLNVNKELSHVQQGEIKKNSLEFNTCCNILIIVSKISMQQTEISICIVIVEKNFYSSRQLETNSTLSHEFLSSLT